MVKRIYYWICCLFCKMLYRKKHVILHSNSRVCRGSVLEGNNLIGCNSIISGHLGRGSYLGENCMIRGYVGRYCSISNGVRVVIGKHPTERYVSTHPCFYSTRKQAGFTYVEDSLFEEVKYAKDKYHVVIGNDVWIGENALIYGGVTIGDGAIVAAGAIVNKDVSPYTIVGGIPAKVLRKRFLDEQIKELLEIKWWDFSESEILEQITKYMDIDSFLSIYRGGARKK